MKKYGYAQLTVAVIFLAASVSFADEYSWDQTNDYFSPQINQSIEYFSPIGQEFTPSMSCLEVVQLIICNESGYSEFIVSIYSDSITGTLLGTSETVTVSGFYLDILTFSFDELNLSPQNLYVMEISQTEGTNAGVSSSGYPTYPLGCQMLYGVPHEDNDLWFREGVFEGSAMDRFSWGSLKSSYRL